jgi:iron complex outermembrane receptor protein
MRPNKWISATLITFPRRTDFKELIITILTCIFLLLSVAGFSQRAIVIKGEVRDEYQRPLAGASISLLSVNDTVLVKSVFTDKNGMYTFEGITANNYFVTISAPGYKKSNTPINIIGNIDINMPAILMVTEVKGLEEITVQSQKLLFEQKSDKMIVNINASPSNTGANALEILEKSPGITVDRDGNISLKGKAGAQIFIDGKPSYISGQDLVNFLRNLPGTQLDQIEIMTNPPAKFDAAGNSGIINIKTKKNIQFGYSAAFTTGYTQGIYARNNQEVTFNYRKNKVNLFGTLSRNERNTLRTFIIDRKFTDPSTKEVKALLNQESDKQNWNASNSFKIGADFFATNKTTIGAVVNGFYSPEHSVSSGNILISNASNVLQANTFSQSTSKSSWKNLSANINFRHLFDSTGKELTADIDNIYYGGDNRQKLSNYFYNGSGTPAGKSDTLYGDLPQGINIYSGKLDYMHQLKKAAKLEVGVKIAYVKTDANAMYDSLVNNQRVPDIGRTNHFIYDERISATYLNYSRPLSKKINSQFGLRLENTLAHGKQLTTGEKFRLSYTQLFPTAYFSYNPNQKNTLTMNYGRRIRRPDYESLNPFVKFLDRYTFEQGNPNLRPQFSHNIELSHSFKSFITTTLNYTKTNNIIQMVMEQNENTNQTFAKQENIASQRQYGISVNLFKQLKNFNSNLYVNVYNNEFSGLVNNSFITLGATTAVFNTSASYKFKNGITTEVNGFYRTAGVEGVFRTSALGAVNLGASIPLLKNKATVRLSVRDIFWTQKITGYSRFGNINAAFNIVPDSRTVSLSCSYRLSRGKSGNSKRKPGGAGDEQIRVKSNEN